MSSSGRASAVVPAEAAMLGMQVVTMPLYLSEEPLTLSSGVLVFVLVRASRAATLTTLGVWVQTAGVTASGVNGLAVYTEAGVLLNKTASMSAGLAAVGFAEGALAASVAVAEGTNYYLSALTHFTDTNPKVMGLLIGEDIPVINTHRPSLFVAAQADFPASFTPAAATVNSGAYFLTAR